MADFTDIAVVDLGFSALPVGDAETPLPSPIVLDLALVLLPASDPDGEPAPYVRFDVEAPTEPTEPPEPPVLVPPTVEWITPPNSSLVGTSSLVAFRIVGEGEVPAISVRFFVEGKPEERAYRQGTFLYPYDQSTQTLNDFRVRRRGGWPSDFVLHVDTAATAGSEVVEGPGVVTATGDRVVP